MAALSKKTKNTTTPNKVVTRTILEGWFTLTEYARTCTEIDSAIRCAMESMSEMNSRSPLCSSPCCKGAPSPAFFAAPEAIHLDNLSTSRFALVTTTTIVTSTATSSSSPIWESRAAPMNSLATEKEIDTERSAPRLDRAPDVIAPLPAMPLRMSGTVQPPAPLFRAPLAPHPASTGTKRVSPCVLKRAAQTTRRLMDGPLLSRLCQHAYLPVFSAFLARREPSPSTSGRKRRGQDRGALSTTTECAGVVYGCCLGSLVAYLKLANVSTSFTVRQIEAALNPAAASALRTRGVDAHLLCASIASSRVLRTQLALSSADGMPSGLHSRNGNPATMIGMCASIFAAFSLLSSPMLGSVELKQLERDVAWMMEHRTLEQVLSAANAIASNAVPLDGWAAAPPFELAALDAEQRAIQRACRGVDAARAFAERHGLATTSAFRKMMDWFCRAAWPPGELLNERTHDDVLQRMGHEAYYLSPPSTDDSDGSSGCHAIPDLVPLAQLSGLAERSSRSAADSDASSIATGSSHTLSSRGSSTASVAGDMATDVVDRGDVGIEHLFEVQFVR